MYVLKRLKQSQVLTHLTLEEAVSIGPLLCSVTDGPHVLSN